MKGFTFAAVAALAATSYAATVKIEQTACIQQNATSLASFDVEVDKLTAVELPSVCGLKIVSADGVDVKSVKCKAYKDAEGTQPGSAEFTSDKPALIATNPVQEGSILCVGGSGAIPTTGAAPTTFAVVSTSAPGAAAPTGATPSGGNNSTNPTSPSSPSTPTPSAGTLPGSASTIGMSFGALAGAAVAMLFL